MQQLNKIKFPDKKVIFLFYYFPFKLNQMKKHLLLIAFSIVFFKAESATIPSASVKEPSISNLINPLQYFSTLSIKEVQKLAGRKLKLKEKIAVKIFQWKIKNEIIGKKETDYKDKGKTALIFGIIALAALLLSPVILFGPLASIVFSIAAIITGKKALKTNPTDRNAKTGIILGWITVGLLVLLTAFIIAFLATWSWGWG